MLLIHRRIRYLLPVILVASVAGRPYRSAAADSADHRLGLSTSRVSVFKDGYYLAVKSGSAITNKDGEVVLEDVPDAAVLGSMWATSNKGKLLSIVASREVVRKTIDKEMTCFQTLDLLHANVGKQAKIILTDKSIIQGTIRTVLAEATSAAPTPHQRELFHLDDDTAANPMSPVTAQAASISATISGITGSQFILDTDEGDVVLSTGQIATLTIRNMKSTMPRTLTTTESPKRLTFRFAEVGKPVDVSLIYFRPGLRWIPTYRVNVSPDEGKKIATISMQAEFLNEAENLENVPIDIVVGVPHFRFRETPSPLVLEATMRNVLHQAAPALMNQPMLMGQQGGFFSNSMFDARSGERHGAGSGPGTGDDQLALPAELAAEGAGDLFVYTIPRLNLRKGQRAAMPILTADVPYRDLYTWDIHETRNERGGSVAAAVGRGITSPLQISENRVWHQLVLSTTTRFPWTTGPAMVVQGTQPLGQDMMTYTSPGGEVRLPITVAVDLRGSLDDEETDRKLNDLNVNNVNYARISKSATLLLQNRKKSPVEIEISFRTGGKATEATLDGKITLRPHAPEDWINSQGYAAVNNSSITVWRSSVKPGESFAPTVKYHYFALH